MIEANIPGMYTVPPEYLMDLKPGSLIFVGKLLAPSTVWQEGVGSVWLVVDEGKAQLVEDDFPNSETEDLDWFTPWRVTLLAVNTAFVNLHENHTPVIQ